MVEIEEIQDTTAASITSTSQANTTEDIPQSQERLLDAQAIEEAASKMSRVSARMHLETLAKRLRKEGEALARVEKSRQQQQKQENDEKENHQSPAVSKEHESSQQSVPETKVESNVSDPSVMAATSKYIPIDRFAFDAGGYSDAFVTLYIELPGLGEIASKSNVTCDFTANSMDLIVRDLNGKSYRLFRDNLEKDIDPDKSKIVVKMKSERIVVKLAKVKQGEYGGFDFWSQLTDKKGKKKQQKDNPQASIMQLMKDMYDEGDDNMKKVIGETMMKQQRGELGKDMGVPDLGMGME